jgi:hypothetical protein
MREKHDVVSSGTPGGPKASGSVFSTTASTELTTTAGPPAASLWSARIRSWTAGA